ncbi:MAG: hypothetical protein LLG20_22795 [Acidobacteriales bacterium]|nr:hypothetical protein [Terriglobales bacterium]
MTDTFAFTDTAETIADNPEGIARQQAAEARYDAAGEEYAEGARAILHSLYRRLTGAEIAHCQCAAGLREDMNGFNTDILDRLRSEFPREIAEAKAVLAALR